MSADWTSIEDAIQTQVVAASGLAGSKVIWFHQSADRPTADFIGLEIQALTLAAPATPFNDQFDNPTPAAGSEIIISAVDTVDFNVRIHFYTQTATGSGAARSRLSTIRGYLNSEVPTAQLDLAGVTLVSCDAVNQLPAVLETKFESRAFCDVAFRVIDGYDAPATIIETINPTYIFNT